MTGGHIATAQDRAVKMNVMATFTITFILQRDATRTQLIRPHRRSAFTGEIT